MISVSKYLGRNSRHDHCSLLTAMHSLSLDSKQILPDFKKLPGLDRLAMQVDGRLPFESDVAPFVIVSAASNVGTEN
jgi:hypothetical protein